MDRCPFGGKEAKGERPEFAGKTTVDRTDIAGDEQCSSRLGKRLLGNAAELLINPWRYRVALVFTGDIASDIAVCRGWVSAVGQCFRPSLALIGQVEWLFTSDNVRRSRPPRVPVVEVGFDECLVANPDRPRPGILPPPAPGCGNLDKCSGIGCPPLQLEPLVRDVPFIAVELGQCAEPLFPGHRHSI